MTGAAWGHALHHLRELFGGGMAGGLEDGLLLDRYASSRDGAAFEVLVARHGPMVLATCRAVLSSEHDAEDAFQATFLVLARKAGAVRGDSLGGWLHRVAYLAAVQASIQSRRRRRGELEATAMATTNPTAAPDSDERRIVHEEINRLPDRHRLPVVLCDLQELSYEEAAGKLGVTVPTLRCRLAKARQRLRTRLSRRGVSAAVGGSLLIPSTAKAAVPASLSRAVVAAATGGTSPAGAVLVSQAILGGMLMTKMKIAATALLAITAAGSACYVALASKPGQDKPAMEAPKSTTTKPPENADRPQAPKPEAMVEVHGRVVSPEGKPVAGARVSTFEYDPQKSVGATSDEQGRFKILLPSKIFEAEARFLGQMSWLWASAPGYGTGGNERPSRSDLHAEQTIRLVAEGPAIEGRILNLEGQPVAGALVKTQRLWYDDKGDLSRWIAKVRGGVAARPWQDLQQMSVKLEAKAGPDGRFRLAGVGIDRVADLLISSPTIATTEALVFCRDEPEIRTVEKFGFGHESFIVHAPKFDLAVAPTRPIQGVARDKDSGKPIAGLGIQGLDAEVNGSRQVTGVSTQTDADGSYRLVGLPRGRSYRIMATPKPGSPYFTSDFRIPAPSPSTEPISFEIALKRGVMARGRITDKITARPVVGAIEVSTFEDNPHRPEFPGAFAIQSYHIMLDNDGRYEAPVLPGRNLIAVRVEDTHYRATVGEKKIAGYDAKLLGIRALPNYVFPRAYAAVVEVNAETDAAEVVTDIQVDPGRTVEVHVVDPGGEPIGGTMVKGLSEQSPTGTYPQESSQFEVHALDPSSPRRLIVTHAGRKLIGAVLLKGNESGPITVTLQPWGTIVGRIVDDEGKPRASMSLTNTDGMFVKHPEDSDVVPGGDWNGGLRLGNDGKFLVEGLVPGLKYSGSANEGFLGVGKLFDDAIVKPGEVKDLGDLKVIPTQPE